MECSFNFASSAELKQFLEVLDKSIVSNEHPVKLYKPNYIGHPPSDTPTAFVSIDVLMKTVNMYVQQESHCPGTNKLLKLEFFKKPTNTTTYQSLSKFTHGNRIPRYDELEEWYEANKKPKSRRELVDVLFDVAKCEDGVDELSRNIYNFLIGSIATTLPTPEVVQDAPKFIHTLEQTLEEHLKIEILKE